VEVGRIEKLSDGGPAFPPQDRVLVTQTKWDADELKRLKDALAHAQQTGMTLRDYFAAAALPEVMRQNAVDDHYEPAEHAVEAYAVADAMLKAREAK
jgi:hypothetical protein